MRPAFYALPRGGWRDYITLLHAPYTAWHLSYVVVGGCLAAEVSWGRLGLTVLAFFLAMGIGAHALDELAGRPLRTTIPGPYPRRAGGRLGRRSVRDRARCRDRLQPLDSAADRDRRLPVPAYNLEWSGGRFHSDLWFAVAWGAFPVVTGAVACAGTVRAATAIAAVWATVLSLAQRRLSTPVRRSRRGVVAATGELEPPEAAGRRSRGNRSSKRPRRR